MQLAHSYRSSALRSKNGGLNVKKLSKTLFNQLNSYMEATNAKIGYAVAFSLNCNLPENVIFIQCPLNVLR